jgi:8-oxo-dGTP pyrophosphatase MutT (NUDIX family)
VTIPRLGHDPGDIAVVCVERLELTFVPRAWPFAEENRAAIAAHFAELQASTPQLWNGRILLLHEHGFDAGVFCGACLETDFASFVAWRDWDFPDASVRNCFGMAALKSADGAFLLGVMGPKTANAGKCYFPAGSLDPSDLVGTKVDVAGSVRRELAEETGLDAGETVESPFWYAVFAGPRIALMKVLQARESAESLRARALHHIATEAEPELADVRIVRALSDLDATIPSHTTAFFNHIWRSDTHD